MSTMDFNTLVSVDPGVSSGFSVWAYSDTEPAKLINYAQVGGGTESLLEVVRDLDGLFPKAHWICEDFQARPQRGFGYTTASLEPLVGIGALIALGLIDRNDRNQMCAPIQQYFVGGKDKAEKKKRQHKWLKDNGFYITGKMVDSPDADDVRSSMAHAISWFRRHHHKPTLEEYFKEEDE